MGFFFFLREIRKKFQVQLLCGEDLGIPHGGNLGISLRRVERATVFPNVEQGLCEVMDGHVLQTDVPRPAQQELHEEAAPEVPHFKSPLTWGYGSLFYPPFDLLISWVYRDFRLVSLSKEGSLISFRGVSQISGTGGLGGLEGCQKFQYTRQSHLALENLKIWSKISKHLKKKINSGTTG